jgi:hypothetical protein
MKYIANPVEVDAFVIKDVTGPDPSDPGQIWITLEGGDANPYVGSGIGCDAAMTVRYMPKAGDYLVRQSDGYLYLNPKEVFERKYSQAVTGSDGKDYPINTQNIPG